MILVEKEFSDKFEKNSLHWKKIVRNGYTFKTFKLNKYEDKY